MGNTIARLFDSLFGTKEMRVVMLGLDAAGKTTVLYKLHIGEILSTVPTIGVCFVDIEWYHWFSSLSLLAAEICFWMRFGTALDRARHRLFENQSKILYSNIRYRFGDISCIY